MWLHEILIGHNRTATLTCIVKFSFSLLFNCICTFPVLFQISDLTWHVFDSSPYLLYNHREWFDWLFLFLCTSIQLIACHSNRSFDWSAIGEASSALFGIQSPLIKYYLYHFHFVLFPLPCNWNVVFISELPPTCQNYQKKVATKWEPCPKTCLKLRKSFQNELAGTTKVFEGLILLHFFFLANSNW